MAVVLLARNATTPVQPAPMEVNVFHAISIPISENSIVATYAAVLIATSTTLFQISFVRPAHILV